MLTKLVSFLLYICTNCKNNDYEFNVHNNCSWFHAA
jgi:hypothetical protein